MNSADRGRPVLLWGMMGVGKSAVARELQSITSLNVVDLDELIHKEHGQSPRALIRAFGLSKFRQLEANSLRSLLRAGSVDVVALGGGCLLDLSLIHI